jgi:hypothetical protein
VLIIFTLFCIREVKQIYKSLARGSLQERATEMKFKFSRSNPSKVVAFTEPGADLEPADLTTHKDSIDKLDSIREDNEITSGEMQGEQELDMEAGTHILKMDSESMKRFHENRERVSHDHAVHSGPPDSDSAAEEEEAVETAPPAEEEDISTTPMVGKLVEMKKSSLKAMQSIRFVLPDTNQWGFLLDMLSILVVALGIVFKIIYISQCREFHNYITQFQSDFETHFNEIITREVDIANREFSLRIVGLCGVAIGLMQFFRYIGFDKRMGLVAATLYACIGELAPIMLVFCTVFSAFAVLGSQMYGQQMVEFETFTDSLTTLLLLVLGEYGVLDGSKYCNIYFAIKIVKLIVVFVFFNLCLVRKVNPLETKFYFWIFILLVLYLLLNMVLAVVLTLHDKNYILIKEWEESEAKKDANHKRLLNLNKSKDA